MPGVVSYLPGLGEIAWRLSDEAFHDDHDERNEGDVEADDPEND